MQVGGKMFIAVDFDGTIVKHMYPKIGDPVPFAIECLKELEDNGHELILFTMRSDRHLIEATQYCMDNGLKLTGGINTNKTQREWTHSPKAYAQIYIDDAALGCPLIYEPLERPYVDWLEVHRFFSSRSLIRVEWNYEELTKKLGSIEGKHE